MNRSPSPGPGSITFAHNTNLWLKVGSVYNIPYIITTPDNPNVPTAISQFNTIFAGVVQWIARTTEDDYVNFEFNPFDFSGSGFSSVGRAGGAQQLGGSINQSVGTLFHEMGHATGLFHEQQRIDRDTFVSMNFNNTGKAFRVNQDKLPENSQDIGYYDYASIMHYFWNNLSKNGEPVITSVPAGIPMSGGDSDSYTRGDIDGIKRLYEAVPSAVTITSNPLGLQVVVDGTTITTPQTFSWVLNSTHTVNVPSPQTLGTGINTRYFTYGRWGDSTLQSHTITVTPGDGNRVTPTNKPAKTVYTAHFIELFKYSQDVFPADAGTMMVSPPPQSYPGLTGQYFVAGQAITVEATPNPGFQFYAWFGNGTPSFSANPQTIKWYYGGEVLNQAGFVPTSSPVYTFNTNPTLKTWVLIDNTFFVGPVKFSPFYDGSSWDPGTMHTINVDSPEWPVYSQASQTRYLFNNWSDAGARMHSITLPSGNATYTANFTTQHFARFFTNSFSDCAGAINVSPPPDPEGYYNDGTVLTISQNTTPGWFFAGWRGDLSGTTSPRMLTVNDEVYVESNHNTVAAPLDITSLSPPGATAAGGPLTLTINGTGFTPSFGTAVWINGTFRFDSTFINSTQMTVPLTAGDLSMAGAFQVFVQNNLSGGCFNYGVARTFFVLSPTCGVLAPNSKFFGVQGAEGSFVLTALASCSWTAASNAGWLEITSSPSGSGTDIVTYIVRDNFSPVPRQGTLNIAGQTFTVVQDSEAAPDCVFSISAASAAFNASGGAGSLDVITEERCAWEGVSNRSWITITSISCGIGNGTISYSVAANPGPSGRSGTITLGGKAFTVKQKGP